MLKLYVKGQEFFRSLMKDERGASLAEYALLIALVLVGVVGAVTALTAAETAAIGVGTAELQPPA